MKSKPNIFISYSHKDASFIDELEKRLSPLRRRFNFELWSDQKIAPGEGWRSKIEAELEKVNIALLLVSPDYLASEWIETTELPRLLKAVRRRRGESIPNNSQTVHVGTYTIGIHPSDPERGEVIRRIITAR